MKKKNQYHLPSALLSLLLILSSLYSFSTPCGKYTDPLNGGSPVSLTSFNARQSKKVVDLEWTTSRETNTNHFILQRSTDGKSFTELAVLVSGEDSYINKTYKFTDERMVRGKTPVYYRLKIVDRDGQYVYSDVKVISKDKTAAIYY